TRGSQWTFIATLTGMRCASGSMLPSSRVGIAKVHQSMTGHKNIGVRVSKQQPRDAVYYVKWRHHCRAKRLARFAARLKAGN
ncbi:hypothetical protein ACK30K_20550, partial [Aeromonas caviae]